MKEIMIKESNKEKIEAAIKMAEGRSTARTITYNDIVCDIARIEEKLNIAKKHMEGIKADVDHNAQDFPSAYKYTPESTQYCIIRKKSGWVLYYVGRQTTRGAKHTYKLQLTDEAKQEIIKAMSDFS